MAWNEEMELKQASARQQWDDIRAVLTSGRPDHCPVRVATIWRKSGDACGNRKIEPVHNEAGEVVGWRCDRGHVFGNPRSAS
jgi:hypothetical protein